MMQSYATRLAYLTLLLIFFQSGLLAQITCDDPLILLADDLDGYTEGDVSDQADHWTIWPGATVGGIVSAEQSESGSQSLKIDGMIPEQDVLLLLGDSTQGHYLLRFDMYVPAGKGAYFNVSHEAPTESEVFIAFEAIFDGDGTGRIFLFDNEFITTSFDYPEDDWFEVYFWADIDSDQARINIDEYTRRAWTFSDGFTNGPVNYPSSGLNSINFYPIDTSFQFYVDNIDFWQIPAAETGKYCYTAVPATVGTNSVLSIDCFGGGYDIGGNGSGKKAYWFTYTPEEDGIISIASCLEGVDTRGWIFEGDCQNLKIVGVNDDQCELSEGGSEWASYREAIVTAGNTYYIMWDDAWEDITFDFELSFTTDDPEPGNFCQSAIAVEPGEHIIDLIDGDAAVAGPDINNTSASTTNYSKSEWYSFTPPVAGTMIISSCDGAGSDTHVFVYTGDCANFSTLNLAGQNDNSEACSAQQSQISLDVVGGTVYYIEWIDRWDQDPFFWNLIFEPDEDVVTLKLTVDMLFEEVNPSGVFLSGSFNGWPDPGEPMTNVGGSLWEITVAVAANATHEYKFQNGPGGWEEDIQDPTNLMCTIGTFGNRFIEVGDGGITIDVSEVCFESCAACLVEDVTESVLEAGLTLAPNPAREQLQLQFDLPEVADNLQLRLVDLLGATVHEQNLGNVQFQTFTLDVEQLPAGTYFLQVYSPNVQLTKKVVIE